MKLKFTLFLFVLFFISTSINAQCIPGPVTPATWGTPSDFILGFTIDADLTDVDTLQVIQGQDTSIVMQYLLPKKQAITSPITGTANVTSVKILGVTGMPTGLNWTLDAAASANNNTYNPQSNRFGSVTICGTTFSTPGVKTLTVSAEGCGSLSGISDCQGQSFPLYIEVLPGQGGNSAFTISPPVGCNDIDVDFAAIFQSPDPVLFPLDFAWDFGDGTTGTGANIADHNYSAPGNYPVKLDVIINEYYISSASVTCISGWYPDVEEVTALQNPDPYIIINGFKTSSGSNTKTKTWTGLDIVLNSATVTAQAWDEDTGGLFGSPDDNLGSGTNTIIPSNGGTYAINTQHAVITFTINKRVGDVITFWDTVSVYSNSVATVTSSNGTAFCGDDSTTLTVGSGYAAVQWYKDSVLMVGQTYESISVNGTGSYYAVVLQAGNICEGSSNEVTLSVDVVNTPAISVTAAGLAIDNPNSYDVQWYSNGVPIPGATGNELTDLSSGNPFTVIVTNANGCSGYSASFEACIGGYATAPNGTALDGAVAKTFEAVGFAFNSQTQIAWAVTPVADGLLTSAADIAAINNNNIYLGDSTSLDLLLNCNTMNGPGNYYLTPFLIEATELDEFPFPYSDTTCVPSMNLSIGFDCVNTDWAIGNVNVIDPEGNTVDILALSPVPITYPIGPQLICGVLGGNLPEISLFDLSPASNPNGTWNVEVKNTGTGVMNVSIPVFQVSLLAADCGDIAADMVYEYGPFDLAIPVGGTQTISVKVPPLPTNFPSIASSCSAFGTPVEIQVTNCVNSIKDFVAAENINLYPNPNNGMFTLNFDVVERNDVKISILDVTGRILSSKDYGTVLGKFNQTFDLKNNLTSGIYFMNIEVGNSSTQKRFIIK